MIASARAQGSLYNQAVAGSIYNALDEDPGDYDLEANFGGGTDPEDDGDETGIPPTSLLMEGVQSPKSLPRADRRHGPGAASSSRRRMGRSVQAHIRAMDPRERALWIWANVENLDNFLLDIYAYFTGNGMYTIILSRVLNMATLLFVVGFSTYLNSCIDYAKLSSSSKLSQVKVPHCMARLGTFHSLVLWLVALFWFLKAFQYARDIKRLSDIRGFYRYALDIPDSDMQTVSWQQVVSRLVQLRDVNLATAHVQHSDMPDQSKQRLDPHVIANRIMRKENYLIAMFNKDVFDLKIPLPWINGKFLTRTMEWHINLCVMDFVFNNEGQVRPVFLRESHRRVLSDGLRRRFIFAGVMNILFSPFLILYFTLLYFFRYFNEYHKDPSAIGTRQYTPLAEWKMREFNELFHLFRRRISRSYEHASRYVNQFPRERTAALARFVTFVAGSFAAVLGIISLVDPELFLGFEITHDRTVLFYLGVFGSIVAIGRGLIPDDNLVFDPESSLQKVVEFTHYMPSDWEGQLHSNKVKTEFTQLYDLKIMIILRELASVLVAPFILWFSLPKSSDRIVDFIRDFSVHVDGVGYICSFAMFDFDSQPGTTNGNTNGTSTTTSDTRKRTKPKGYPVQQDLRDNYFSTTDGKMLKSYLNFVDVYGGSQTATAATTSVPSRARREYSGSKERRDPGLEHSVMGRFRKMKGLKEVSDGKYSHGPGDTSLNSDRMADSMLFPSNDNAGSGNINNGNVDRGVLGLLNEFYQQVGTGNAYNRI